MRHNCKYRTLEVECEKADTKICDCHKCGWNPKVEKERKEKIRRERRFRNHREVFSYVVQF